MVMKMFKFMNYYVFIFNYRKMNSNIIFGVDRIILVKYIVSYSGFIWEKLITILQLRDSN